MRDFDLEFRDATSRQTGPTADNAGSSARLPDSTTRRWDAVSVGLHSVASDWPSHTGGGEQAGVAEISRSTRKVRNADERYLPLHAHLLRLVLMAVLPVILASVGLIIHLLSVQHAAMERSLQDTVQALSLAVDGELGAWQVVADSIAASPLVDSEDIPALYLASARAADANPGARIGLVGPDGTQLFNTARPFGTALPNVMEPASTGARGDPAVIAQAEDNLAQWRDAFSVAKPRFSNLYLSRLDRTHVVSYRTPAIRDGIVKFFVTLDFPAEGLNGLLQREGADGWIASITDLRGRIAARSVASERFVGTLAGDAFRESIGQGERGISRGLSLEGLPLVYAYARSRSTGWTVSAGLPLSAAEAPLRVSFWLWSIVVGVLVVLGVFLARRLWTEVGVPLRALAQNARALEYGEAITIPPSRVREVRECSRAWEVALQAERERRRQEAQRLAAEARTREAERTSREKDRLLAALSHELRNPLGAISNSVHVLEVAGPREGVSANMIAIIKRQAGHLGRLLDDLLDLARATFGKMSVVREPLEVLALVEQTVEACRSRVGSTPPIEVRGDPVWVDADRTRLDQVMRNLVDNAIKFTQPEGHIRIGVAEELGQAVISVSDDGAGIPPELIDHLFDAFAQNEQTIDRSQGGLGLGLALVRTIIDLHGGKVSGTSEGSGKGACFTVRLPVSTTRRASAPHVQGSKSLRVLVVEDIADVRDSMVGLLEAMGHVARAAADAIEARAVLEHWKPDAMLIDRGLPGVDGATLARELRADCAYDGIRFYALSGYADDHDLDAVDGAVFDGRLLKPASRETLERLLGRAMAGPRTRGRRASDRITGGCSE